MGVENNFAVLATTYDRSELDKIVSWIASLDIREGEPICPASFWRSLFLVGPQTINGKNTIVMIPDTSKRGWELASIGDKLRKEFIEQLSDDSWQWIEVGYGEFGPTIEGSNTEK